ncbi:MAG: putative Ig domain-containing protein, partial [Acidobacteriota bacterium]|nr:putative Ig domain-containing protein [Acidobacteriota bacterium]
SVFLFWHIGPVFEAGLRNEAIHDLESLAILLTGGTGTGYSWTWAAASGSSLPAGLSLSTAGVISGTPTASGTFNIVITVTDSASNTASGTFSLTVQPTLTVTTTTLPSGTVGVAYSQTLAATGGTGTGYTWSVNSAGSTSLAAIGLSLASTGVVSGATPAAGTATFTATVTDSASHTASATLSVTVYAALTVTTSSLPAGYTGIAYSQTLTAAGGTGTGYTWTVTAGASSLAAVNLAVSSTGVISGTPASTGTASFTVQVTDSGSNTATASLTIVVYAPLTLPSTNPSSLPSGTVNQSYSGSINAGGGVGPYTWTINGTTVTGTPLALSNGLSATNTGGSTLSISGTPTTTTSVSLSNVTVKDSTNTTAGPDSYSITVNSAGSQVSGQITLNNYCGSNGTVPAVTVSINTSPVQTTTTDSSGNYSFASVPNGTYTITPSISGPSSVFYPATQSISVNNSALTGENFQVVLGYTVSGTVSYSGSKTGKVYLALNSTTCGNSNSTGTTIAAPGSFTIRGVAPGSYTLAAGMDTLGFGAENTNDPSGTASVTVGTANVTGAAVTMADPAAASLSTGPKLKSGSPFSGGAVLNFKPITDSNGVEMATSYTVQWSTSSSFGSVAGSKTFAATGSGGANIWILSGLTNGSALYFRAEGTAGSSTSSWSATVGPITIGAPTSGNTVSGTVTFTGTATGPLYVGFYDQNTGSVYADAIASPSSPQAYTVQVPTGSNYYFFGIIDQNNDGLVDAGDITNTNAGNGSSATSVSGNTTLNLTLPSAGSTATVTTQHYQLTSTSGTNTGYSLGFDVRAGNKLPVAVTLTSGPNVINPVDIAACTYCGTPQFYYSISVNGDRPTTSDAYAFLVTYSDGTSETLTATVSAVLDAFATNLAPQGTSSTSTTPTFTWTDPSSASSYIYQFYLWDSNGNTIWQIPGNNSKLNGFDSTITSITWGTDPTGGGSTPTVGSLTSGATYNWQISVQDSNGNSAQTQVDYIP